MFYAYEITGSVRFLRSFNSQVEGQAWLEKLANDWTTNGQRGRKFKLSYNGHVSTDLFFVQS